MCNEANIEDPEIKKLCEEIRSIQQREIEDQLNRLEKKGEVSIAKFDDLKIGYSLQYLFIKY